MGKEKKVKKKEPEITAFIYGVDETPEWFNQKVADGSITIHQKDESAGHPSEHKDHCKIIRGTEVGHLTRTEVIEGVATDIVSHPIHIIYSPCGTGDYMVREISTTGEETLMAYTPEQYAKLYEEV